jgi:4-amino-4-deoxy-L-arabinose transferase-like glycosyltransferase
VPGTFKELSDFEARGRIEKFSAIFSLIILGLIICFLGLSIYGLFDVDETRFAASALEMVRSGDYLVPSFNGEPRLTYPVLYYWFLVGFLKIFGFSPGAFRLVSAVFAFGLIMTVGHIVYRESRVEGGFLAGVILATSSLYAYMARIAMADMVFSVLLFLSSILLYLGTFDAKRVNRTMIRAGAFAMALAVLTKGITGLILPFLSLFLFSWLNGRLKRMADAILDVRAIVIFLMIVLPWYVAAYIQLGSDQFYLHFVKELFNSALGVNTGHRGPIYYFVPVIVLGMFPWTFFLPQTVFSILKERGFSLKAVGENISLDMFLLLFSLPLFPALAIITALYLEKAIVHRKYPELGFVSGAYAYALASFLLGILFIYPKEYFPIISEAGLTHLTFYAGLLMVTGGFFVAFFAIIRKKIDRPRVKIFAAMLIPQLLFLWFVFFAVLPGLYQYRQIDLQEISRVIKTADGGESPVIFYKKFKPSVTMLTGRVVHQARTYEEVIAYTSKKQNAYLIFPGTEPTVDLTALGVVSELYQGRLYSLYKIRVK